MAGAVYQVVTGSFSTLPQAIATASLDGWLVFGSIELSSSVYSVLMGRGTGYPVPLADLTHSLNLAHTSSVTASGIWQNVFPPQSATDTLLGINTNPNKISVRS
jgi:hypothetical protein